MNVVQINGKTYTSNGSISVINGKVIIDGKEVTEGENNTVEVIIEGNVDGDLDLSGAYAVTVKGDVTGSVTSKNGNVTCGNVGGNVETKNGNIIAGKVLGDAETKNGNIVKG